MTDETGKPKQAGAAGSGGEVVPFVYTSQSATWPASFAGLFDLRRSSDVDSFDWRVMRAEDGASPSNIHRLGPTPGGVPNADSSAEAIAAAAAPNGDDDDKRSEDGETTTADRRVVSSGIWTSVRQLDGDLSLQVLSVIAASLLRDGALTQGHAGERLASATADELPPLAGEGAHQFAAQFVQTASADSAGHENGDVAGSSHGASAPVSASAQQADGGVAVIVDTASLDGAVHSVSVVDFASTSAVFALASSQPVYATSAVAISASAVEVLQTLGEWTNRWHQVSEGTSSSDVINIADSRQGEIVLAGDGDDVVVGSNFDDLILGGAGDDALSGNGGNDIVVGGTGSDVLVGGQGHDILVGGELKLSGAKAAPEAVSAQPAEDVDHEVDTVSYADEAQSFRIDLSDVNFVDIDGDGIVEQAQGTARRGDDAEAADANDAIEDVLIGIENVIGGHGDDVIIGDDHANVLRGGDGDDEIFGDAGDDVLVGGAGDNILDGGAGDDTVVYVDVRDHYRTMFNVDGSIEVHRVGNSGSGSDKISNVERYQFGDLAWDVQSLWRSGTIANGLILETHADAPVSLAALLASASDPSGHSSPLAIVRVNGVAIDHDAAPDLDTLRIGGGDGLGYVVRSGGDGQLMFVADADASGVATFTYTVRDQYGDEATLTGIINVLQDDGPQSGLAFRDGSTETSLIAGVDGSILGALAITDDPALDLAGLSIDQLQFKVLEGAQDAPSSRFSVENGTLRLVGQVDGDGDADDVIDLQLLALHDGRPVFSDTFTIEVRGDKGHSGSDASSSGPGAGSSNAGHGGSGNSDATVATDVELDGDDAEATAYVPFSSILQSLILADQFVLDLKPANDTWSEHDLPSVIDLSFTAYQNMDDLLRPDAPELAALIQDGDDVLILLDPLKPEAGSIVLHDTDITQLTTSDFRFA